MQTLPVSDGEPFKKRGPDPADGDLKLLRLVAVQPGGFASAKEVNENSSTGYKQTRNRLYQLADRGLLNRRKIGNTKAYYLSDDGEAAMLENVD
jgi:hypothetical protein